MIGKLQNSVRTYKPYSQQQANRKNNPAFGSRFEEMEKLAPELISEFGQEKAKEIATRLFAKSKALQNEENFVFRSVILPRKKGYLENLSHINSAQIGFSIHEERPASWLGRLLGYGERLISKGEYPVFNLDTPETSLEEVLHQAKEKRTKKYPRRLTSPQKKQEEKDISEIKAIFRGESPKELPPPEPPKMLPDSNNPYRGVSTKAK